MGLGTSSFSVMETCREGAVGFWGGVEEPLIELAALAPAGAGDDFLEGEAEPISSLLTSLVENMRVSRSLTVTFSPLAAFGSGSPAGTWPFCGFNLGEAFLLEDSMDLMEAGWEEDDAVVVDLATGTEGVLAIVQQQRLARRWRWVGCVWW